MRNNLLVTSLLLLTAVTPPAFAAKQSGTITFVGAIYEAPCTANSQRIECSAGTTHQKIDLASLQRTPRIKTVNSEIHYQKSANKGGVSILMINYL